MCKKSYREPFLPSGSTEQAMRTFKSGATRGTEKGKLDFEGFFSPLAVFTYAEYLDKHRLQPDGSYRGSDNWQNGMDLDVYAKSEWRHHFIFWAIHRGYVVYEETTSDGAVRMHLQTSELENKHPGWKRITIKDALCGVIFNAMGYLHELAKEDPPKEGLSDVGNIVKFKRYTVPFDYIGRNNVG